MRRGFEIEEEYVFLPKKEPEKKGDVGEAVGATLFWAVIAFVSFCLSGMSWWTIAFGILFAICFCGIFGEACS